MRRRGVCYDVGRVMWGHDWRPAFSAAEAHRELAIIREDLHCNAVRLCGQDLDRLRVVGADALDQALEVLDMASYILVKSFGGRLGVTYPDLPWAPKQSFWAVAECYGASLPPASRTKPAAVRPSLPVSRARRR